MAAPDSVTLHDLSGTFVLNKTLSDSSDAVLAMQGVSWLVRRAIAWSTITLHVKEYTDDAGFVHIDIAQSAGSSTNTEERTLNWEYAEHDDKVFGKLRGRTRFVKISELEEPYLKNGWDPKFLEAADGEVIQSYVESISSTWTANQTWGFEVIKGERRYTRHVHAVKGKEEHRIKLVYDWKT